MRELSADRAARLTRDGRMAVFPLRLPEADIYLLTFQD